MPEQPRPLMSRGIQAVFARVVVQLKSTPPSPFGHAFLVQTHFELTLDNLSRAIVISPRDYAVTKVTDNAVWLHFYDLNHRQRFDVHFTGLGPI